MANSGSGNSTGDTPINNTSRFRFLGYRPFKFNMRMPWDQSRASSPSIYSEISEDRIAAQRRSSPFFNPITAYSERSFRVRQDRVPKPVSTNSPQLPRLDMSHLNTSGTVLRSPTSTRSIIDPSGSPARTDRALSTFMIDGSERGPVYPAEAHVLDYGGNSPIDQLPERNASTHPSRRRRRRREPRWIPRHSRGKIFFPAMKNQAVRNKVFHCIVSGSILAITLIVCKFVCYLRISNSSNLEKVLALSTSSQIFSQEFRIVAILFVLVFTVLFLHSMIRLAMLLYRAKKGPQRKPHRDLESGYVRPSRPIQVVLARDEAMGLSGSAIEEVEKTPPPPPPAYGLWRGSVVSSKPVYSYDLL